MPDRARGGTRIAVLVPSCDAYSDMWEPFFRNLRAKWPDLPFPCYLVSNEKRFEAPEVRGIRVGPDRGWSSNLRRALEEVPEEGVLLFIDDLFLRRRVDTPMIRHLCERFGAEGMEYLRFNPTPGPEGTCDADGIGAIPPGDAYRASTVMSLWRREVLLHVLQEGETAWDLEVHGSARTDCYPRWFACRRPLLPTWNLVVKGRYEPSAWRALVGEGLPIAAGRPVMDGRDYLAYRWVLLRSALFGIVPRSWRRRIRDRFRSA